MDKNFFQKNWLNLSNAILLIGFIIRASMWFQTVEDRLIILEKHTNDKTLHMTLEKNIEIFVTRNEYKGLIDKINKIDTKVDLLLTKELNK